MRIAISSAGKTTEDLLDVVFGRCEYFQIHDTESGEIKILENKGKTASNQQVVSAKNMNIKDIATNNFL